MTAASSIDARIATLARRFHNVLQRSQLTAIGVGASVIARLLRLGWLSRYAQGVYIVGTGALTPMGRMRAAAVACGSGGLATADSTLHLYGILDREPRSVTVLTTSKHDAVHGARFVRTTSIAAEDRTSHRNVPSTTVERALVELSASTNPLRLLKFMRRAQYLRKLDVDRLERTIARLRNRGTCTNIIRALTYFRLGDGGADSALEERMHAFLLRWGFRDPRTNIHVTGLLRHERADFVWLDARVIVEIDGPHHLDPDVRREDMRRDAALGAAGFNVVRVWWWELDEVPGEVRERIRSAFGNR